MLRGLCVKTCGLTCLKYRTREPRFKDAPWGLVLRAFKSRRNPSTSPMFEPWNSVSRGEQLTPRPQKYSCYKRHLRRINHTILFIASHQISLILRDSSQPNIALSNAPLRVRENHFTENRETIYFFRNLLLEIRSRNVLRRPNFFFHNPSTHIIRFSDCDVTLSHAQWQCK